VSKANTQNSHEQGKDKGGNVVGSVDLAHYADRSIERVANVDQKQ
jgi:hypothetical protein